MWFWLLLLAVLIVVVGTMDYHDATIMARMR